jgi:hypothetical protein
MGKYAAKVNDSGEGKIKRIGQKPAMMPLATTEIH